LKHGFRHDFKKAQLKRDFNALGQGTFDLIIIGGGIVGAGVARDAALRGLNTLLVEKNDFGCGTTSRSTRLVHGGLRYLRMFDFKLVRQDLHEREILLDIAPHLVHHLEFVIPMLRSRPLYRLALPFGLSLYNLLSHGTSLPSSHRLSVGETLKLEPSLSETAGLTGALAYYDCQSEYTERVCIENILDASSKGTCVINHAMMTDFIVKDSRVNGIMVRDMLTGEERHAQGRIVLNASGPWADAILQKVGLVRKYHIRKTKGIHLITDKITNNALVLFAHSDGRLFFVIPWLDYSLIGTTDTDYPGDPAKAQADRADVDYLVTEMRHYFPGFKEDDILYTQAGIRALVHHGRKASSTSRAHRLIDHERRDSLPGFISILGGKHTAYRGIAEEAVDLVCRKLGTNVACRTAQTRLPGAPAVKKEHLETAARESGLPLKTVAHLAGIYGSRYTSVLGLATEDKRLSDPIIPGRQDILAQLKHAIVEESALSVSDFMVRRSFIGLGPEQGLDAVGVVAQEMGKLLGWNKTEVEKQIKDYRAEAALGQRFRS
jgi:glycerol-3-phosphate dehydrogenase